MLSVARGKLANMNDDAFPLSRRAVLAAAVAAGVMRSFNPEDTMANEPQFWPNGARLALSFSLMFEAGGQPISGAGGIIPDPIANGLPDLPTNAFFQYGVYEGIPRLLDLFDRHDVKMSSFMIGQAVDQAPELAREIVRRGHEAAAHGRTW
jgi:peptidoglycan/xylan/chitin deacetylase (PgdA/CDA1 family)